MATHRLRVRHMVRRLLSHPQFLWGVAIGALLGISVAGLPLFAYVLPDSSASLMGAALGAAIAVLGARVAADRTDLKYSVELINATQEASQPLVTATTEFLELVKRSEGSSKQMSAPHRVRMGSVMQLAHEIRTNISQLKPAFDRKPEFLVAYVGLNNAVYRLISAIENFDREDTVRQDYQKHISSFGPNNPHPI